ncbi:cytochrome d ubiquinol oxidase subunit II [bacterium]|nr:MAG: cytochrome d ubiquinol oxidase subunit II [bacterium]
MDLNIIWFLLVGVLIIGYAILDGFDLGAGVLSLFTKRDHDRRIIMNAIGPVWDGNEVWLITGGGALFAAFPRVYATVFSSFYLALILLLLALIFRAVSFEFRGKVEVSGWRAAWDRAFGFGSLLPALLFGVAVGNILRGIPLNSEGVFTGTFLGLLNPYALLVGILSLVMFTMHGAIYLTMKTEGELHAAMEGWINRSWMAFVVLYVATTIASYGSARYLFEGALGNPLWWILFLLILASIISIPVAVKAGRFGLAFISSSLTIACAIGLAFTGLFPRLVPSFTNLDYSLTIYNASSTPLTHWVMFMIALIGMPIVLIYTIWIYRIFKGKVQIHEDSY